MKLHQKVISVLDYLCTGVTLTVDMTLAVICFTKLSTDWFTSIAYVAIGIMNVLLVFMSWSRKKLLPWIIFATVVGFIDWSFALESSQIKTVSTDQVVQDAELVRIQSQIDGCNETLGDLHVQYSAAMKRETMDEINNQIEVENEKLNKYNSDYEFRFKEVEKQNRTTKISANDVLYAVPTALKQGRYIPVIFWALIFFGMQLVVVTSIDNKTVLKEDKKVHRKRRTKKKEPKADDYQNMLKFE